MRGTDRYVIIFVAGIVVLVIVALTVAAMQPEETYSEGNGPDVVAHNYLLAIEQRDYERAYTYLDPDLKGYPPDFLTFMRQIRDYRYQFPTEDNSTALTLLSVEEGDGWADADVRMTVNQGGGIFGFNRYTDEIQLYLVQTADGWKIAGGERLFVDCWSDSDCK